MPDTVARITDLGGPVHAQRVAAGLGHQFEPLPTALGEQDHRHLAAIGLAGQTIDDALHVGERERLVIARGQCAAPGVEHLDGVHARFDLRFLLGLGLEVENPVDTLINQQLLENGRERAVDPKTHQFKVGQQVRIRGDHGARAIGDRCPQARSIRTVAFGKGARRLDPDHGAGCAHALRRPNAAGAAGAPGARGRARRP